MNQTRTVETNFKGRLKNTSLSATSGLLPVYEAVVNSIQSVDEAGLIGSGGEITIRILRDGVQGCLALDEAPKRGPLPLGEIVGFDIEDNGTGFNVKNIESFRYLDSDYKASLGCKGVGRLLWLKAFDNVHIESSFRIDDNIYQRTFLFTADLGKL
jgi:hypothetical protein